jgi:hypothetical protein
VQLLDVGVHQHAICLAADLDQFGDVSFDAAGFAKGFWYSLSSDGVIMGTLLSNSLGNFVTVNRHVCWRFDSQPHLIAFDAEDFDFDIKTWKDDLVITTARENQHSRPPFDRP